MLQFVIVAFGALSLVAFPFWPHSRRWGYYPGGVLLTTFECPVLPWLMGVS